MLAYVLGSVSLNVHAVIQYDGRRARGHGIGASAGCQRDISAANHRDVPGSAAPRTPVNIVVIAIPIPVSAI